MADSGIDMTKLELMVCHYTTNFLPTTSLPHIDHPLDFCSLSSIAATSPVFVLEKGAATVSYYNGNNK